MKETSELIKLGDTAPEYTKFTEPSQDGVATTTGDASYRSEASSREDVLYQAFTEKTPPPIYVKQGTIWSSSVNLSNSNIGIGTVGLAFGIKESGWLLGIILFIICHFINHITMYMMMEVAQTMHISSYAIVCNKCKVPVLQIISDYSMVINKLLSCSSYLILIGDFMSLVIEQIFPGYNDNSILYDRRLWICIWLILFIIPTNCLRKIDALRYTSFFALLCFFYLLIMVQYYCFIDPPLENPKISIAPQPESPLSFFKTISLFIYAYGGHPIAFGITTELINPTMKRLNRIIWNFCVFSTFIFASVAFSGYFTFGEETNGNLLINYPDEDTAVIIVRIGICFGVGFTYPLLGNVIKNSLGSIIYGVGVKNDKYSLKALIFGENPDENERKKLEEMDVTMISAKEYYPLVAIVIIIPMALSLSTDNLSVLFQFNGATVGTFNQVIFPALIYYFACKNGVIPWKDKDKVNWKKIAAIVVLIGGSLLIPFMVFYAFDSLYDIV